MDFIIARNRNIAEVVRRKYKASPAKMAHVDKRDHRRLMGSGAGDKIIVVNQALYVLDDGNARALLIAADRAIQNGAELINEVC